MRHILANYIIIPLITITVGALGRYYTSLGMDWYNTLTLPAYTPPNWIFSVMWNAIFLLTTIAALIVWNSYQRNKNFLRIFLLFALNAFFNIAWSYLFFYQHQIALALIDALLLNTTILFLMIFIAEESMTTALLLSPYIGWVSFAIILNTHIWFLN